MQTSYFKCISALFCILFSQTTTTQCLLDSNPCYHVLSYHVLLRVCWILVIWEFLMSLHGRLGWGWVKIYWCSMLRLFLFWVNIGRDWVRKAKSAEVSTITAPGQFNFGLPMCTFVMPRETAEIAGNIHFCPSRKISQIEADGFSCTFHWSPIELKAILLYIPLIGNWAQSKRGNFSKAWKVFGKSKYNSGGSGDRQKTSIRQGGAKHKVIVYICCIQFSHSFLIDFFIHQVGISEKKQTMRKENCLSGLLKLKCW